MGSTQAPLLVSLFPFILVFLVMYVLIILPQQKQQKKHRQMLTNLKKNDEVVTIGGVHGTIVNVKEKTFILRIDDNVKVEIDKSAIASVTRVASV
jgi:preprotein translocase subunit YajC